jgi:hypothetical protein
MEYFASRQYDFAIAPRAWEGFTLTSLPSEQPPPEVHISGEVVAFITMMTGLRDRKERGAHQRLSRPVTGVGVR